MILNYKNYQPGNHPAWWDDLFRPAPGLLPVFGHGGWPDLLKQSFCQVWKLRHRFPFENRLGLFAGLQLSNMCLSQSSCCVRSMKAGCAPGDLSHDFLGEFARLVHGNLAVPPDGHPASSSTFAILRLIGLGTGRHHPQSKTYRVVFDCGLVAGLSVCRVGVQKCLLRPPKVRRGGLPSGARLCRRSACPEIA